MILLRSGTPLQFSGEKGNVASPRGVATIPESFISNGGFRFYGFGSQ
jgi:hypothetical protein